MKVFLCTLILKIKKITNMISIVPNNVIKFEDEAGQYNFPIKRTLKMMDIMEPVKKSL